MHTLCVWPEFQGADSVYKHVFNYQKTSSQRLHWTRRARGSCTFMTMGQSAPGHNCSWKWLCKKTLKREGLSFTSQLESLAFLVTLVELPNYLSIEISITGVPSEVNWNAFAPSLQVWIIFDKRFLWGNGFHYTGTFTYTVINCFFPHLLTHEARHYTGKLFYLCNFIARLHCLFFLM